MIVWQPNFFNEQQQKDLNTSSHTNGKLAHENIFKVISHHKNVN